VLIGFGAGLAWAAAAVQWGPPPAPRKRTAREKVVRAAIYPFAQVRSRVMRAWYRIESRLFGSPKPTRIDKDGKKK
jgi:hypothetical protein